MWNIAPVADRGSLPDCGDGTYGTQKEGLGNATSARGCWVFHREAFADRLFLLRVQVGWHRRPTRRGLSRWGSGVPGQFDQSSPGTVWTGHSSVSFPKRQAGVVVVGGRWGLIGRGLELSARIRHQRQARLEQLGPHKTTTTRKKARLEKPPGTPPTPAVTIDTTRQHDASALASSCARAQDR